MSAEDELVARRMDNGEIWIMVRRCGDTCTQSYGQIRSVLFKATEFAEAAEAFERLNDPDSAEYAYTEYGGHMPTEEELKKLPVMYVSGMISLRFRSRRRCSCVDLQDAATEKWEVHEYSYCSGDSRIIASRVSFVDAVCIANAYRRMQPGDCKLRLPLFTKKAGKGHKCIPEQLTSGFQAFLNRHY